MKQKVLLGMSGGVDSSVAAVLLREAGYEVVGVTLKLRPDEYMTGSLSGGCCSLDDINDAKRVADALEIPHYVLNFTDVFSETVIDYFVRAYKEGRTPNPCIACNRHVKFEAMLQKALSMDMDYIATGHYAVIERNEEGRYLLRRSRAAKDQSYVLYTLTQPQLAHTLFPLGDMDKEEARTIARAHSLPVANKPDSQEICFVENKDYAGFIERYTGEKARPGAFIDRNGAVIGKHQGLYRYTVGQRKGLGGGFGQPMYVTGIDPARNQISLGEEGSQYTNRLVAGDLNWISFDRLEEPMEAFAKVRYQARPAKATLTPGTDGRVEVQFEEPQRAVTPGQAVVFYDERYVLGGGTIEATGHGESRGRG